MKCEAQLKLFSK
jgi:hypothetical protein